MGPTDNISFGALVESKIVFNSDGKKFLPLNNIDDLVRSSAARTALEDAGVSNPEGHEIFIEGNAKRVFLILALMNEMPLLEHLREHHVDDSFLPLIFDSDEEGFYCYTIGKRETSHRFCESWRRSQCILFETYMWRFMTPPSFGPHTAFRRNFRADHILPFLTVEEDPVAPGFFGDVFKLTIHKEHLDPSLRPKGLPENSIGIDVAIKKMRYSFESIKSFKSEAANLNQLNQHKSPHLVKPIAAYEYWGSHCLMLPWAHGGSLIDYWRREDNGSTKPAELLWLVDQFTGLSSALRDIHRHWNSHQGQHRNCIHGNLKPENILLFEESDSRLLKIADMGEAAFRAKPQHISQDPLGRPRGTSRYTSPETSDDDEERETQGRAYDLWSMGCVILELLVWLTSGYKALVCFKDHTPHFWRDESGEAMGLQVFMHPYVNAYMEALSHKFKAGGRGDSWLMGLLDIVRKLLANKKKRLNAGKLTSALEDVRKRYEASAAYQDHFRFPYPVEEIQYYLKKQPPLVYSNTGPSLQVPIPNHTHQPGGNQAPVTDSSSAPPGAPMTLLHGQNGTPPSDGESRSLIPTIHAVPDTSQGAVSKFKGILEHGTDFSKQFESLDNFWRSVPDSEFPGNLIQKIGWDRLKPRLAGKLCDRCRSIERSWFPSPCDVENQDATRVSCDLCRILFQGLYRADYGFHERAQLCQDGSSIRVKNGPELLSIYSDPDQQGSSWRYLGLPNLPEFGSEDHFLLLKGWLSTCDLNHDTCSRKIDEPLYMPTRLVKVGRHARLVDATTFSPRRYVALSHRWGPLKVSERYCTLVSNIAELKQSIDVEKLPLTFRDAIFITQGLGIDYIWIDSMCIIQDDSSDWESEARRMGYVFSNAYCTIGASSAESPLDGFLGVRTPRDCVPLHTKECGTLYVCPSIDDFAEQVELGPLNRRGWVLQERVLSRRVIHYTSTQVYWECGDGVRCETMRRLRNPNAAFFGDANFPSYGSQYPEAGRQLLVQELHEKYSRLQFTKASDRSLAIMGLQMRIKWTFNTEEAYGLFASHFSRGLLWQRDSEKPMQPIEYPGHRYVPSWSWLSKLGPIKYMDLRLEQIDWVVGEFQGPFRHQTEERSLGSPLPNYADMVSRTFDGIARKMHEAESELSHIVLDDYDDLRSEELHCVIIGRDKKKSMDGFPVIYALVIRAASNPLYGQYERVGVATLSEIEVEPEGHWAKIQ